MNDIKFVDGLMVKAPRSGAPDFVKGSISIKRKDLGNWLRQQEGDWINLDIKESKGGKWYAAVNDWKPENKPAPDNGGNNAGYDDFDKDDIPF